MSTDGFDFNIKVDVAAAVDALTRVVYRLHPPRDVDEGAVCDLCIEPWPCEPLRDFEHWSVVFP